MGLFNLFKPAAAKTVLVVDVVALNESLGTKGNIAPRNQLQTLRRLARFSQREKIEVVAISSGEPLNKAPAGKKFEGIVVQYSDSAGGHPQYLAKAVRAKGPGAVLVSGNAEAEKILGTGPKKMRMSTFRKALDTGGDPESSEGGAPTRSGGNRPPRNNNRRPKPAPAAEPLQERSIQERPAKEMSNADAINELIDLVD